MNLGKKLRRIRQVRGLSVVALAKHARVTPGFISQLEYSQTVPSLLAEAKVRPSGAKAMPITPSFCPLRRWRSRPVGRSQRLTVLSRLPVAIPPI